MAEVRITGKNIDAVLSNLPAHIREAAKDNKGLRQEIIALANQTTEPEVSSGVTGFIKRKATIFFTSIPRNLLNGAVTGATIGGIAYAASSMKLNEHLTLPGAPTVLTPAQREDLDRQRAAAGNQGITANDVQRTLDPRSNGEAAMKAGLTMAGVSAVFGTVIPTVISLFTVDDAVKKEEEGRKNLWKMIKMAKRRQPTTDVEAGVVEGLTQNDIQRPYVPGAGKIMRAGQPNRV